ncbi:Ion transport 2 domain protein [Leucobacter coleopterorum]|uniref:Ion transport 2 domain protein n=1 Tax=Leucobacter coleopterorum TaxID=2714933 RepID=A0ABX6K012_9MICO|nr:potassium channel family protein [Leucobacter coleopterorum]QIM18419.1 Ion transport 2 domain protein [Leucobacter coleopterorum]
MKQQESPAKNGIARVEKWEMRTAWPLFLGSVAFVTILTWTFFNEGTREDLLTLAIATLPLLWVWFATDYFVRLGMAGRDRRHFIATRSLDLASLILPFLRPFLILVYIWRLPVFRHGSGRAQRVRYILTITLFTFMLVYTESYCVWLVERDALGANIVNFGDALWWGFATIATVGYGDFVPVTVPGRVLAVTLMVGGFFAIGVVTATLVSELNDRIHKAAQKIKERREATEHQADTG